MTISPIVIFAAVVILLVIAIPIYFAKRESKKKGLETALAVSKSNHPSNTTPAPVAKKEEPYKKPDVLVTRKEIDNWTEANTARRSKTPSRRAAVDPYVYERQNSPARYESDSFPSNAMIAAMLLADSQSQTTPSEFHVEEPLDIPEGVSVEVEEPSVIEVVDTTPSFSYTPEPSYSEPVPSSHSESYSSFSYTPDTSSSSSYSSSSDSSSSYSSSSYDSGSSSSYSSDSSSSSFSFD